MQGINSQRNTTNMAKPKALEEVVKMVNGYCCYVDGSWISPTQNAGIGWTLHNKEANLIEEVLQLLARQAHLRRLKPRPWEWLWFKSEGLVCKVTFFGDSANIYKPLADQKSSLQPLGWEHSVNSKREDEYWSLLKEKTNITSWRSQGK